MKAKEYLKQLNKIDAVIKSKLEEIERWKGLAVSITVSTDGERVQSSGDPERMASAVSMYVDLEREVVAQLKTYEKKRQEILQTIEGLSSSDEYEVVYRHYVKGEDFQTIADALLKSYRWVTSVNGNALVNIQKLIE